MKLALVSAMALLVLLTTGCEDDPAGPGGGSLVDGTFSATVNGSAFSPQAAAATFDGGIVGLSALNAQGAIAFVFVADGPGTYTIAQTIGNNASYSASGFNWGAGSGVNGSSGSVTFSTLNDDRAVGNFTFTLQPLSAGASGTRTVNGNFDLAISHVPD